MHRFFAERTGNDTAVLPAEEAAHALRVLRLQKGASCQAILEGKLFDARLMETAPEVTLRLLCELPSPEPSVKVTLYQGLPKGDKMEWIVQKCTEAGVVRVVPVLFSRCVAQWEKKDSGKKLPRWQRIAAEAAKQSGRAVIPEIGEPLTVKALCEVLPRHDLTLTPWEEEKAVGICGYLREQKDVAVIIGPEGGIAPEEIVLLKAAGAVPVTLGPRILRTETAGLASLLALMALTGNME